MKIKILHFSLLIVLLISCSGHDQNKYETQTLKINEISIDVEIADTVEKREKGLMNRKELDADKGMLFIFEKERKVSFWMKNTEIALSVAYISKSGYIREIHDLKPYSLNSVQSSYSVLYALEVNQGYFKKNGIKEGDQLLFP